VGGLSATQIKALEVADLAKLSTSVIAGLTTTQVAALTAEQVCNLTTTQLGALTTTQIGSLALVTPIVLDLNDDGIKTLSVNAGVKFDMLADGTSIQTGWVGPQDGLLVSDRNQDGLISDGSELFGSSTALSNGTKALDGYQALAEFDTNKDGVVDQLDTDFNKLSVWMDSNSDGVTGSGELKSLTELGITQLSVKAESVRESNAGNLVGLTSTYQTVDGKKHESADVWFVVDKDAELGSGISTSNVDRPKSDSNQLATAISDFNYSALSKQSFESENLKLQNASNNSSTVVANSNKLTNALRDYQLSSAEVALNAIPDVGKSQVRDLVAIPLEPSAESEKFNAQKSIIFDIVNKSK
jgi:hypothetical protein